MASPSESNSVTIEDPFSRLGVKSYQAVLLPIYELLALISELREPHLSQTGVNYQSLISCLKYAAFLLDKIMTEFLRVN